VDKRTGNSGHLNQTGDKNTELWPPKPISGQEYGHIKQPKIIKVSFTSGQEARGHKKDKSVDKICQTVSQ